MTDIARLRELLDKASVAPPWDWDLYRGSGDEMTYGEYPFTEEVMGVLTTEDATLIAEAINSLPGLLDALDSADSALADAHMERDMYESRLAEAEAVIAAATEMRGSMDKVLWCANPQTYMADIEGHLGETGCGECDGCIHEDHGELFDNALSTYRGGD